MGNSEQDARRQINQLLVQAGWHVCDIDQANIAAHRGAAILEFPMPGHGFADYLLYIDSRAAVIEAKKAGATLSGVDIQSAKYIKDLPEGLPRWRNPLPWTYANSLKWQLRNNFEPYGLPWSANSIPSGGTAMPEGMGSDFPGISMGTELTVATQKISRASDSGGKSCVASFLKPGRKTKPVSIMEMDHAVWQGDVEAFLNGLPIEPLFDLVVSSPPYNIGKSYETRKELDKYLEWQERIIDEIAPRLKKGGSLCWQVGNFVVDNQIFPLDIEFAPIFKKHKLQMRNRIIWRFGHGLHTQRRFSGRYEVVLWYTKTESTKDPYTFNLDAVRIPAKYPGKKHFKGPKAGQLSGNPLGKNPEDVWDIPNVKSNHVEKTDHPCQYPVGLIERLVLALTNPGDLVFDPFAGVGSAGVAAAIHKRRFWGCELLPEYAKVGHKRIQDALKGDAVYRHHDKPVYDHTQSNLSKAPAGFRKGDENEP